MAETGRLAAYLGLGKGFEIREYPVPEPKPGLEKGSSRLTGERSLDLQKEIGEA